MANIKALYFLRSIQIFVRMLLEVLLFVGEVRTGLFGRIKMVDAVTQTVESKMLNNEWGVM